MSRKRRTKAKYQTNFIPEEKVQTVPKIVQPKTRNQDLLLESIQNNLVTFAIGEAGTGKSYLSVGSAIEHVYNGWCENIIFTRPIVEVGNNTMGFLPGSATEKLEPYMSPLFDAVTQFWPSDKVSELNIKTRPLNFMRGVTFRNSFVILDEANNCTREELKMVLTRFGEGSKIVINGDPTQSDLPVKLQGALAEFAEKLANVNLIGVVHLDRYDIVRHDIVADILKALD